MKLMGADALLAGGHQVEAHQPLVQGDMAALHDRAGGDGEVLAAFRFRRTDTSPASWSCRRG